MTTRLRRIAARRTMVVRAVVAPRRSVELPEALVDRYLPRIGHEALVGWVVLRLAATREARLVDEEPVAFVARVSGMGMEAAARAMRMLTLYELVAVAPDGRSIEVREPLTAEAFQERFGEELAEASDHAAVTAGDGATPGERGAPQEDLPAPGTVVLPPPAEMPAPAVPETAAAGESAGAPMAAAAAAQDLSADLRGVLDYYQQRIGLISDVQFRRLAEWVVDRQMSAEVVARAIEEAARTGGFTSFSYVEGVLRNWYNQGVRTWADLERRRQFLLAGSSPGGGRARGRQRGDTAPVAGGRVEPSSAPPERPLEGVPNADAYRPVSPDLIRRWKELSRSDGGR